VGAIEVLDFWFADGMEKHWFRATQQLDAAIRARFEPGWQAARRGELDHWADSPDGALALAILLDQFPLNMFRGQAQAFATEAKAIGVALDAVARGLDQALPRDRVAFLYMPLMHSEDLAHQDRAVRLFERAGLESNLRFARHHRELIRRFGRFPHRNAVLGRASTVAERDYLASKAAFMG
jgi:uncharacterized protein (DUF924 family)